MRISICAIALVLAALLGTLGLAGCGSSSSSASTAVAAPVISTQPASLTVVAGTSATFTVAATGSGTLSYQWYFGTTAVSGATSATLTVASATSADAGSYYVIVTNSGGSVTSSTATLTVNTAPSITTQPASLTVVAGASASFTVAATGSGTLTYQWYFGTTAISGATSATLTLATVSSTDAGSYYVTVTNTAGTATSSTATLTVTAAVSAPTITTQPASVSVAVGGTATFTVAASGSGTLSYQWYFGTTAISGATASTYTIATVAATDAGSYYAVVTNPGGSTPSSVATLTIETVATAPSITTQPVSASVAPGGTATFTVVASGSATLAYQWYFGTAALAGATSATLTLTDVAVPNAGSYYVLVTNGSGTATSDAATLTLLAETWNFTTGANALDLVAGTTFNYTLSLALDTMTFSSSSTDLVVGTEASAVTPVTLNGTQVMTLTKDTYGLTVKSDLPDGVHVEFLLSGTYAGSVTLFSEEPFKLGLNGARITSSNGPAINIQSNVRAFVVLYAGTTNTLTDSSTYSTRYLSDGTTAMDLKGALFSEGPLIFSGTGALTATGNKKQAICSDAHVRLVEGTLTLVGNKKDGLHTNNAFIMDGGTLGITTASGAGKGIKVEGKEDTTQALGFIVINAGTLTINSYDKAITAGFEASDDGTTTTTADDPDPFVTINGGTITITTFGTPYEDTNLTDGDSSLSPEGIESKSTLTINGGTLSVVTTDDALNAIKALVINGGTIYARGTANDAVDSNGTMTITGGVIVADGATGAEGGLDCDENAFTVTGGTFVGIGGRNSTPTATLCTQNTVSLGSASANTLVVVTAADGTVALAFKAPYACTAMLVSSSLFKTGTKYTVYTGGSFTSYTTLFNGLYLGGTGYSGGTAGKTFTISAAYTSL